MTELQTLFRIILPQMIFIALPMMSNVLISEFQDTALAFTIGLVDLMGQAKVLDALSYNVHTLSIYVTVALIFWVLALICEKAIKAVHEYLGTKKKLNGYGR
jgi:L-cystine transport system permease protein